MYDAKLFGCACCNSQLLKEGFNFVGTVHWADEERNEGWESEGYVPPLLHLQICQGWKRKHGDIVGFCLVLKIENHTKWQKNLYQDHHMQKFPKQTKPVY